MAFCLLCVPVVMVAGCQCDTQKYDPETEADIEVEAAMELAEAEEAVAYPGAKRDMTPEALQKAASAGGSMFLTADSMDKVLAYHDGLAGSPGYSKYGSSRYVLEDAAGHMVDIMVMPAGDEGAGTYILVTVNMEAQ